MASKFENVYAMLNGNGEIICYTSMSDVEAVMFGAEALAEMNDFKESNPGVSFVQDPDYVLAEVWQHEDGSYDMVARYTGGACPNEGCDCRDLPYAYFVDGIPAYSMTEGAVAAIRVHLRTSGAQQVSLEIEAH